MCNPIESRLSELGVTLPDAPAPAANYVPYKISGSQIFISGQLPMREGGPITGKLGADLDIETGTEAAKLCAINLLSQARAACGGDLSRLAGLVKLTGFVNSTPDFTAQPKVINGASDFFVEVMGESGRHARSAVSAGALPFNVAVEIEAVFELA